MREKGRDRAWTKETFSYSIVCLRRQHSPPKKPFQSCEPDRSDIQIQSRTIKTDTLRLCFCKRWKVEVVTQRKAQINTYPPDSPMKAKAAPPLPHPTMCVWWDESSCEAEGCSQWRQEAVRSETVHFSICPPKGRGLHIVWLHFKDLMAICFIC